MKKIVCFFMVALLAALLVVPCFASEITVDRGDPVDWFGGESGPYTCSSSSFSDVMSFLQTNGFSSSNRLTVSSGSATREAETVSFSAMSYKSSTVITLVVNGSNWDYTEAYPFSSITFTVDDISGLDVGNLTFTGSSSGGFVDSGFSDALTELSTIVSAILSNQYILIAIGFAVAVPLVAWGISKLKSLVKGY